MSNENKLSPVTVYVPIKPKPDEKNDPIKAKAVSYVTGETLEPQEERYVFNREELEGLLGDVMGVAFYIGTKTNHVTFGERQCSEYIQSLF